jgi:hypothetical protein
VHLTTRGDIIVMDHKGLLASRRNGGWKLYDKTTCKDAMSDCLGDSVAGANLFEIVFDLSYRRHGALLVYDPGHEVVEKVVNHNSLISGDEFPTDDHSYSAHRTAQSMIADHVRDISVAASKGSLTQRRLVAELASIDGALIFDDRNVLAVGALIASHPKVSQGMGARSTAALSAYHWGGKPIKVSSDGEITFYFESADGDSNTCDATLEFL